MTKPITSKIKSAANPSSDLAGSLKTAFAAGQVPTEMNFNELINMADKGYLAMGEQGNGPGIGLDLEATSGALQLKRDDNVLNALEVEAGGVGLNVEKLAGAGLKHVEANSQTQVAAHIQLERLEDSRNALEVEAGGVAVNVQTLAGTGLAAVEGTDASHGGANIKINNWEDTRNALEVNDYGVAVNVEKLAGTGLAAVEGTDAASIKINRWEDTRNALDVNTGGVGLNVEKLAGTGLKHVAASGSVPARIGINEEWVNSRVLESFRESNIRTGIAYVYHSNNLPKPLYTVRAYRLPHSNFSRWVVIVEGLKGYALANDWTALSAVDVYGIGFGVHGGSWVYKQNYGELQFNDPEGNLGRGPVKIGVRTKNGVWYADLS
ncbi:hypothetical protein Sps_01483 [Shewanella psychrophila]|uniref:Uncharacterized protein n=1 Tax=Shewanella psychrophila TaxID=225848 RepID=A0A1S6HMB5_9GAMM|nr:hypothetical protein [Shewanella psychrophila]AQS36649.1 hypothetical protein Sps_01483 [Shewanella psychrophila]